MGAVPFDTLKLARRLESAGFAPRQAGDTAEALAEAMAGAELATTADVVAVRTDLKAEIAAVRAELKAEIAALRAELKAEIASVRTEIAALRGELKAEIAAVRAEIELLRRDITIRLGSMIVVAVGILLAAIRYLPASH
jgi:uncharacterized protein involved in exopolysaccharide biosynthesis